jgi:hypothetical protein
LPEHFRSAERNPSEIDGFVSAERLSSAETTVKAALATFQG